MALRRATGLGVSICFSFDGSICSDSFGANHLPKDERLPEQDDGEDHGESSISGHSNPKQPGPVGPDYTHHPPPSPPAGQEPWGARADVWAMPRAAPINAIAATVSTTEPLGSASRINGQM